MNRSRLVPTLCLALAAPAAAVPPLPDGDAERPGAGFTCDFGTLNTLQPIQPDSFSQVHLASPAWGATDVPLNVELILGGFLGDLDIQPPFMEVALVDAQGADVPSERDGHVLRPLVGLQPFTEYNVVLRSTPDCPGCVFEQATPFTTGDHRDRERPMLSSGPEVQVFVMPVEEQFCGFGKAAVVGSFAGLPSDAARISVALTPPGGVAQRVLDHVVTSRVPEQHFLVRLEDDIGLGDELRVALTAVDMAGNASPARIVRVRARSIDDVRTVELDALDSRQCDLPDGSVLSLPEVIPTNAMLRVQHPLEAVPLGLASEDDVFPLLPVEHVGDVQRVEPLVPLPADTSLEVTPLECPHCACPGCNVVARGRVRTGGGPDETAPDPPVIIELREDLDPPRAEERCYPDRTALVLVLEPGGDDTTAAAHLTYDVTMRLEDRLAVEVGRALPATPTPDGLVSVRLDTTKYGRMIGEPMELVVTAVDLGGNRADSRFEHAPDAVEAAGGCSAQGTPRSSAPAALALVLLPFAAIIRRCGRRRS
jgi:hypothetical protein